MPDPPTYISALAVNGHVIIAMTGKAIQYATMSIGAQSNIAMTGYAYFTPAATGIRPVVKDTKYF